MNVIIKSDFLSLFLVTILLVSTMMLTSIETGQNNVRYLMSCMMQDFLCKINSVMLYDTLCMHVCMYV